jgi:hypothetical protein
MLLEDELLVIEQEDIEVPCDDGGCDNPAKWALTCPGCRNVNLICAMHRKMIDALGPGTMCLECRFLFPWPLPWVKL